MQIHKLLLNDPLHGSRYSRMDQVKFFKGCLPQILLGPFLNTLTHYIASDPSCCTVINEILNWRDHCNFKFHIQIIMYLYLFLKRCLLFDILHYIFCLYTKLYIRISKVILITNHSFYSYNYLYTNSYRAPVV